MDLSFAFSSLTLGVLVSMVGLEKRAANSPSFIGLRHVNQAFIA